MRLLLCLGLVVVAGFTTLGFPASFRLMLRLLQHDPVAGLNVGIGVAAGAVVGILGRSVQGLRFLDTLCHELSHASWAFLAGGSVNSLHATAGSGGHTHFVLPATFRGLRSFLVTIAPYWFCPVLPIGVLALVALEPVRGDGLVLAGGLFGFVLIQPLLQWHIAQPDLRAYGVVAPLAVAAWLWTAVLTAGLATVTTGNTRGLRTVYVASCRVVGIPAADRVVGRASEYVEREVHPQWLALVRAASSAALKPSKPDRQSAETSVHPKSR